MNPKDSNSSTTLGKKVLRQVLFWLLGAALLFFVFSNREYNLNIRLVLVAVVSLIGFCSSVLVNQILIPRFLFRKKRFLFFYLLTAVFLISLWIIIVTIFMILLFSISQSPDVVIPDRKDVTILLAGNYLMIILAGIIHFIEESYQQQLAKNHLEQIHREMELKLREARLKLMQDQIHPHFIFNMLNNLYGLVAEDTGQSRRLILKLSDLLEYILYECNEPLIPLEKELSFIQDYIDLERIRHEDFKLTVNFPDNVGNTEIAPLVLFPFVENAFKHGLGNASDSFINISLMVDNGTLIFTVKNSKPRLSTITRKPEKNGIGLQNIQERLSLVYGEKSDFHIHNDDKTYQINLRIKLK